MNKDFSLANIFLTASGDFGSAKIDYPPLTILLLYFYEEFVCENEDIRNGILLCIMVENPVLSDYILKDSDLALSLTTKIALYF